MKFWQRRLLTVLGVVAAMYAMIFVRVSMEASREFREAEQHYQWWKEPSLKRGAMLKEMAGRKPPQEAVFSEAERREKILELMGMQKEKKSLEKQQVLRQSLAEYYFIQPDQLKADLEALATANRLQASEKESLQRDLGDVFEMSYEVERFKREMTEYYYKHQTEVRPDLDKLLADKMITRAEHKWLLRELEDIKEVFESDIKTAFYGYSTVLDIWLDPPAWPPSVLRNNTLARKTRELIGPRESREEARLSGKSEFKVTSEFEQWVREVTPPVESTGAAPKDARRAKGK